MRLFGLFAKVESVIILLTALSLSLPTQSHATWTNVGQFQDPVDCGYFFDENHGMVGTGIRDFAQFNANIYRTSDGGASWHQATTPPGDGGAVTDIFMQTALKGYASIIGIQSVLWVTTDGGETWSDDSPPNQSGSGIAGFSSTSTGATCVYAIDSSVILTDWGTNDPSTLVGGVWHASGVFEDVFYNEQGVEERSNGIDFSDNLHGVVTMGPLHQNFNGSFTPLNYYTKDGGLTWATSSYLPESWGIYAVKNTSNFFCAGEGQVNTIVFRSTDYGVTWNQVFDFSSFDQNFSMTGHIAGKGNTLYVQTEDTYNRGMYRSDDLGKTWKNVTGNFNRISNSRDTRFVVTGCLGQVVYAFDDAGGIWKTTDGGDGTLVGYIPNPAPIVGTIPSARAGDTVDIPIFLQSSGNVFNVNSLAFHLSYNTDVLTPTGFVTSGTLSANPKNATFDTTKEHGVAVQVTLNTPITENSDLTKPLLYLRARVTLSDSLESAVTVDSFGLGGPIALGLCSVQSSLFTINQECGDSTISKALAGIPLASLVSIIPNPARQSSVSVMYQLADDGQIELDVMNALGQRIAVPIAAESEQKGTHQIQISTSGWPSGMYFVVLRASDGNYSLMKLMELR